MKSSVFRFPGSPFDTRLTALLKDRALKVTCREDKQYDDARDD